MLNKCTFILQIKSRRSMKKFVLYSLKFKTQQLPFAGWNNGASKHRLYLLYNASHWPSNYKETTMQSYIYIYYAISTSGKKIPTKPRRQIRYDSITDITKSTQSTQEIESLKRCWMLICITCQSVTYSYQSHIMHVSKLRL